MNHNSMSSSIMRSSSIMPSSSGLTRGSIQAFIIKMVETMINYLLWILGSSPRMTNKGALVTMAAALTLASCSNFRPLYGKDKSLANELSRIEIEEIDTINGAELYHNLENLLGTSEDTKYLLKITPLSDSVSPLAITGHAAVVKQNVTQLFEYALSDKISGKILNKGKIRVVGSYEALSKPYASYTKEKTLKKNLSQNAAEEIYMRLMLYFSSS